MLIDGYLRVPPFHCKIGQICVFFDPPWRQYTLITVKFGVVQYMGPLVGRDRGGVRVGTRTRILRNFF